MAACSLAACEFVGQAFEGAMMFESSLFTVQHLNNRQTRESFLPTLDLEVPQFPSKLLKEAGIEGRCDEGRLDVDHPRLLVDFLSSDDPGLGSIILFARFFFSGSAIGSAGGGGSSTGSTSTMVFSTTYQRPKWPTNVNPGCSTACRQRPLTRVS